MGLKPLRLQHSEALLLLLLLLMAWSPLLLLRHWMALLRKGLTVLLLRLLLDGLLPAPHLGCSRVGMGVRVSGSSVLATSAG